MTNFVDITGEKYGKLTAVCPTNKRTKSGGIVWVFKCDCGKMKEAPSNSVRRGLIKSCGCLRAPHNGSNTRLFNIWVDMRQRCNNANVPNFSNYGGRGIFVCQHWNEDFIPFRDWAIKNGYSDKLSIDRIDVNGNYEPNNCRWATTKQQSMNTRKTRKLMIDGQEKPLLEWCKTYGISRENVYRRKKVFGWSFEKSLKTPCLRNRNYSKEA